MQIKINGKTEEIPEASTLEDIIEKKKINPKGIVVEYNSTIIARNNWLNIKLNDNDTIEIISFVGGG